MHSVLMILGSAMFGLVALIFLIEAVGYLASGSGRRVAPADPLSYPGSFNLDHPESTLMRHFRSDRLARWT